MDVSFNSQTQRQTADVSINSGTDIQTVYELIIRRKDRKTESWTFVKFTVDEQMGRWTDGQMNRKT